MKYTPLFFAIILGTVLFSGQGMAQEDNVTTATTSLQSVLANLKASVANLNVANDQLATRDNAV